MKIEVLDEAKAELTEAIGYYDDIEPGLGVRLKNEVRFFINEIVRVEILIQKRFFISHSPRNFAVSAV